MALVPSLEKFLLPGSEALVQRTVERGKPVRQVALDVESFGRGAHSRSSGGGSGGRHAGRRARSHAGAFAVTRCSPSVATAPPATRMRPAHVGMRAKSYKKMFALATIRT